MVESHINVLLVDDQALLREGFRRLLELEGDGITVVGMASNGIEAITHIEELATTNQQPDVVLMDIRMPRMNGVTATRIIHERWPVIRVMILTTFDDEEYIVEGLQAGARGYLLKDSTVEQLVAAIRAVHRGESPLQPSVATKLVDRLSQTTTIDVPSATISVSSRPLSSSEMLTIGELTEREREIIRYLAQGASNREISEALFITEGTVKNHISNILAKLGLRDRTQAALYAKEHGLG